MGDPVVLELDPGQVQVRLAAFRQQHRLNKSATLRLLQRHGLAQLTFKTFGRWERGERPRDVYARALGHALAAAARELAVDKSVDDGGQETP